ncbi:MAG: hypothetical protein RIB46_19870 [Pseudomonadales bacterium]
MRRFNVAMVVLLGLAGCGSSIEGVYSGEGTGFLDQIEIIDDEKVEVKFMGTIRQGTYELKNDVVRMNIRGDISELRIYGSGCLEGEGILGRYCKTGAKASGSGGASGSPAGSLAGSRFAAGPRGDEMVLEFLDDRTVLIEMDGDAESLPYESRDGRIVIHGMDGNDVELVSRGRDLEGGPEGMVMVFRRL